MHDVAASTIAEYVGLIHDYGKEQGTFSLTLTFDETGDYHSAFIFGHEAEDSPMAGGASYGYGKTAVEALQWIVDECRLVEKRNDRIRSATTSRAPSSPDIQPPGMAVAGAVLRAIQDERLGLRRPEKLKLPEESGLPDQIRTLWGIPVFLDPELSPGKARLYSPTSGWTEFDVPT